MNLPEISIRRPVLACMLSAVFIVFGIISYFRIPIQETPNISFPTITITTELPGATPEVINEMVTKPIENVVNTISGVEHINSSSKSGRSSIEIEFNLHQNMSDAFNEVQSKLNQVKSEMPTGIKPFVITKESENAAPIMLLALSGNRTLSELNDLARNTVKKKLENIPGVGAVNIQGVGKKVVRIHLDLTKMAAMGMTLNEVQNAFSSQHAHVPGGFIASGSKQYNLNLNLEFHQLDALKNMVVAYRQNAPLFLHNIAKIDLGLADQQQMALFNGKASVGINIVKKSGTNTVAIVNMVKERLQKEIIPLLPQDVAVKVVYESASYILAIIHELEQDAWLSILAAGIIIWLFLKNLRSTLIIMTAIPVSLLGVVMAIYFLGYTFNIITLLGIIVLVGVVVDDAIVVLENIYRTMQRKTINRMDAAIEGSQQVMFAVLAATLTLVSIFLPVIFIGGVIGLFFKSFAVVVSAGVVISLFVSMTLTPMLCSRFLKVATEYNQIEKKLEAGFVFIDQLYRKTLNFALDYRWLIIFMALIVVLLSVPIFMTIGKGYMPENLNSGHFTISVQAPQGSSIQYTKNRVAQAEAILKLYPEVEHYFSSIGPSNQGTISIKLSSENKRQMTQPELVRVIQKQLKKIPGVLCFVNSSEGGASLSFEVRGASYEGTIENGFKLLAALQKRPELGELYIHVALNQPQYELFLDRILANSLGLTAREVGSALTILGGGVKVGKFNLLGGSQRYNVVLKAKKGQFTSPADMSQVYLRSKKGEAVRLDTIASLESSLAPVDITRTNLNYSVSLSTTPNISMNKAIDLVKQVGAQTLPKDYQVKMIGNAAALEKTIRRVAFAFFLIILLMYMVLASQFNSFVQPFIIMVAQPLAVIGGLLILWVTQQTLNIYSMIGMLLLMGLVAKNSILLIDLTNQLRSQGSSIREALLQACPQRMRPVVMTSLAIILAMLPAAVLGGADASSHRPMALVIIGGMISSTLLTLIVVPSVYSLIENGLNKIRGNHHG